MSISTVALDAAIKETLPAHWREAGVGIALFDSPIRMQVHTTACASWVLNLAVLADGSPSVVADYLVSTVDALGVELAGVLRRVADVLDPPEVTA